MIISDLGTIITGKTPTTKNEEFWNGKVQFVTPGDIQGTKHISSTARYITELGMKSVKGAILPKDAVCVSCIGNIGYVGKTTEQCISNQQINSIIVNEKHNSDYVYYLMKSLWPYFKNYEGQSTTLSILNKGQFSKIEVIEHTRKEEDAIAEILNGIDNKIENNLIINDNLLQQAQSIFMQMFGDITSVTMATIADIALNITDGVHNTVIDDPEGQYLLLSCKNIKGGLLSIGTSERRINLETFEKLRRRTKLAKGDILISSVGTVGELLLLNTNPSNYEFQRSVAIVKPNPELVSSAYVYESLVTKKAELINAAHGAVQQCLFISDIAGFPIGIPNPRDLRSFDDVVNPMFDTITANEGENLRLEALRNILLPKLMSGELDVSDLDI